MHVRVGDDGGDHGGAGLAGLHVAPVHDARGYGLHERPGLPVGVAHEQGLLVLLDQQRVVSFSERKKTMFLVMMKFSN